MRVRDTRLGQGIEDEDLPNVVERAWYVSGTWLVTGEHKKDTITPTRPFLKGGYGAIEVGARLERLSTGSGPNLNPVLYGPRSPDVLSTADLVWTTGVNWYVNKFFERVGLERFLSVQRRSGLGSMISRIQSSAKSMLEGKR